MAHITEDSDRMNDEQLDVDDEDLFFGKLTLNEVKKRIFWKNNRHINIVPDKVTTTDCNTSIKIIETHSQPNLRAGSENEQIHKFSSVPSSPCVNIKFSSEDDSFLTMENMVSELCLSPGKSENPQLNNTLDVIEYILNNGPNKNSNNTDPPKTDIYTTTDTNNLVNAEIISQNLPVMPDDHLKELTKHPSPKKLVNCDKGTPEKCTPIKTVVKKADEFVTPQNTQHKTPMFKTPTPISHKKPFSAVSLLKTPNRNKVYQHIQSPVASYIKKCPQVPLIKDVHPTKPLPGPSAIPKFVKTLQKQNKENIILPSVAYKSSKKTKVIHLPDQERLPQSQWAKKIATTLPRPTIMKHENRQMNLAKSLRLEQADDSISNLSCLQAEVSVCTQKTAFNAKH